LDKK
jgi:hypothetical protein